MFKNKTLQFALKMEFTDCHNVFNLIKPNIFTVKFTLIVHEVILQHVFLLQRA